MAAGRRTEGERTRSEARCAAAPSPNRNERAQLRALHRPAPPAPPAPPEPATPVAATPAAATPAPAPSLDRSVPERVSRRPAFAPPKQLLSLLGAATALVFAIGLSVVAVHSINEDGTFPAPAADAAPTAQLWNGGHESASSAPFGVAVSSLGPVDHLQDVEASSDLALAALAAGDHVPYTGGYTDLIRKHFGVHTVEAIVIVQCESNFRPNAVGTNRNGTQDHGLFQINDVHRGTFQRATGHPWADRYIPEVNVKFAAWLFERSGGWGPWQCNRNLVAFDD